MLGSAEFATWGIDQGSAPEPQYRNDDCAILLSVGTVGKAWGFRCLCDHLHRTKLPGSGEEKRCGHVPGSSDVMQQTLLLIPTSIS